MPASLQGIRVVDFGRYIAGPFCAALLGDLGAEVIRVEKRDGRDDRTLVSLGQSAEGAPREGALYLQMNRNKRSLALDPTGPHGREVMERLIDGCDVIVANLPRATLAAMGLHTPIAATPVKLHATPGEIRRRPPLLGEHNAEILSELGYSPHEIARMSEDGTI